MYKDYRASALTKKWFTAIVKLSNLCIVGRKETISSDLNIQPRKVKACSKSFSKVQEIALVRKNTDKVIV